MIAGDPTATKPQSTLDVAWRCNGDPGGVHFADIPNCPAGTVLQAFVSFPECWDGMNLDSADHRSHMAYAKGDRASCPKTHPVKLPQLTFELSLRLPYVAGASYELSSGGRYSMHGDFFAAWDDRVQAALVNSCLNGGLYCENFEQSMVDLLRGRSGDAGSRTDPVRAERVNVFRPGRAREPRAGGNTPCRPGPGLCRGRADRRGRRRCPGRRRRGGGDRGGLALPSSSESTTRAPRARVTVQRRGPLSSTRRRPCSAGSQRGARLRECAIRGDHHGDRL